MFNRLFLASILLLINAIVFGQPNEEDYQVYAAIIKTEIGDSTKSVAIIQYSIDSTEKNKETYLTVAQLTSNNPGDKYQIYGWTENSKHERPSIIDSNSTLLLIDYCKSSVDKFTLTNNFNQVYKTVLIKKFPIRRKFIQEDWETFYEKYPGSGGIFSFSKIKYYLGENTAICYYWVRRNGLNGHGALAVLKSNGKTWEMEYKVYLWHN